MENEDNEFNPEEHKDELASLKRLATQLNELQKWLLNTSLASLAFAFTVMFQIKNSPTFPNPTLAAWTIGFLIVSVIGGIFIRARNELANFLADAKGFFSFLPVLRDMVTKSPEVSDAEKLRFANYVDGATDFAKNKFKGVGGWSPYVDVGFIAIEFGVLVLGLGCLCVYVWLYLFGN